MSTELPFFLAQNKAIGQAAPEDDFLHPAQNNAVTADSCSETQYFGFSVPEEKIHGLGYLWHHPNLGVLTGGIWAWQGIKRVTVASEMLDIRAYMKDTPLTNDLHDYRLENSYGVRVIEPMRRHHLTFNDPQRSNHVDLHYTAVTPAVMFGDGKHFEQGMRVQGEITMRGRRIPVNGYTIRDRSWAKPRPETPMPMPPVSWMTCTFDDTLAINCNLFDHVGSNDLATGAFAVPVERALNGGWVCRNGVVSRIVSGTKRVEREPGTLLPRHIELALQDDQGRTLRMTGTLLASAPWGTWANIAFVISLMRWECDGKVGHGDCQEALWTDYVVAHGGSR